METTFIYSLHEPGDPMKIRYIGVSKNPFKRLKEHISKSRCAGGTHKANWIRSLLSQYECPQMEVLDEVPVGEWQFWEREYIRLFRAIRFDLVNGTSGGDGVVDPSPESILRRSISQRGCVRSPETRARMSAAFRGRIYSMATREKMSLALRNRSAESRAKQAIAQRGHKHSAEAREKMSFAQRKRSPESRVKQAMALCGHKTSFETRAKIAAALRGRKLSPDIRAKISASRRAYFARKYAEGQTGGANVN